MNWIPFEQAKWADQPLPPVRRYLLVQVDAKPDEGLPPAVAVGYLRFAAGDHGSPTFSIPGVGGAVVAWCDCLGDDFMAPLWPGTHKTAGTKPREAAPDDAGKAGNIPTNHAAARANAGY